ncbi:MAG TPA: prolipoprotein diacylglyceryl transferase [Candidatus Pseudogracilibacillus intestinigallinarum]|uniref:Phosphatidylglycerol--prolipoprotein diacylglyceryl transferase n=1 Tax=Candidatus Pseudogracilibacillus intestinigallinarum TaxID=2838742 RepID=A0A9D1TJ09_9BACI|nr:prolipoprotein diacylglyceryl transferase [Candidatus Pseudogracilibacillus intestinigallinarum]
MMCEAEPLNRVFLEIGSLSIYWYGVIIATGLFLGLYLATKESERLGLQKDIMIDLVVFAAPIAILFARIYYVIFEFDAYRGQPWWKFIAVWEGGIAIHGALIGAVLTGIVFAKVKKVSFWQIADIAAPSIILGQAIGRWGNFMNQEAHGGPISQAAYENFHQYLPNFIMDQMCINGVMYYPTFLYESIWNIIVFTILILMRKYNPLRGEIFLSYIALYSVGRVFIEGLRTDSLYFGPLRQAQLLSIVLIVGAIIIIIIRRKSGQIDRKYDGSNISSKKKKRK